MYTISGQPGATAIGTSTDGGMTWHSQLVPEPTKQWNVDLIDPIHWRLADRTVLMATDDAGKHWRTMTPPTTLKDPTRESTAVNFLSLLLGWALSGPNGEPLWCATDGVHWKPITITAGPYRLPTS